MSSERKAICDPSDCRRRPTPPHSTPHHLLGLRLICRRRAVQVTDAEWCQVASWGHLLRVGAHIEPLLQQAGELLLFAAS